MDKLKLLETTFEKLSADKAFMAYYLKNTAELDHKTKSELVALLNCPLENYYKLGLCKAPEPADISYQERINAMAAYSGTSAIMLNYVIKTANAAEEMLNIAKPGQSFIQQLQHTIDKVFRKTKNPGEENIGLFARMMSLRLKVYQAALSTLVLVFLLNTAAHGHSSNTGLYVENYGQYKDSIIHIFLQDNTSIKNKMF